MKMLCLFLMIQVLESLVLLTTDNKGTVPMIIDPSNGSILKKGIKFEQSYTQCYTIMKDGEKCQYIVGSSSYIYHYDCSSLEIIKKYDIRYDLISLSINDLYYDNNNKILYGVMSGAIGGEGLNIYITTLELIDESYYQERRILSLAGHPQPGKGIIISSNCYDEQNNRIIVAATKTDDYTNKIYIIDLNSRNFSVSQNPEWERFVASTLSCIPGGNKNSANDTFIVYEGFGYPRCILKQSVLNLFNVEKLVEIDDFTLDPAIISTDESFYVGIDGISDFWWVSCDLTPTNFTERKCGRVFPLQKQTFRKLVWTKKYF